MLDEGVSNSDWPAVLVFTNEPGRSIAYLEDGRERQFEIVASGATIEEILNEYPHLQREDVLAAIAYGAEMSRERYVPIENRSSHQA